MHSRDFEDELVLVTAPDHPLAESPYVDADETYLTYNAQPTPGFEYDRFIRPAQTYPLVRAWSPNCHSFRGDNGQEEST
ncbi:MAG: hypothetical protein P8P20_07880 [Acidimicrobiales bacterium]|nr:hypothetical protein [Acidimicrobiales bacterium]